MNDTEDLTRENILALLAVALLVAWSGWLMMGGIGP